MQDKSSHVVSVGVLMGSQSDWSVLQHAAQTLDCLKIPYEARVVSAHRTPDLLFEYAHSAKARRLAAIIAGAGGAAHLPGMLASKTPVPVLGVPIASTVLQGVDSVLSILQMPRGVPVATFAIGKPGAVNAALFCAAMLAHTDKNMAHNLQQYRDQQTRCVLEKQAIEDEVM